MVCIINFNKVVYFHPVFLGYGFSLGGSMFIKEIDKNGLVAKQGELKSGDVILKVYMLIFSLLTATLIISA